MLLSFLEEVLTFLTIQGGQMDKTKEVAATKEEFCEAIRQAVEKLGLKLIARTFGVSLPTVRRWASGENAPHPLLRGPVINKLNELLQKKAGK